MKSLRVWILTVVSALSSSTFAPRVEAQPQIDAPDVDARELPPPEYQTSSRVEDAFRSEVPAELGAMLDPNIADAAVIVSVVPGDAAAQAGLEPGDTIEAINNNRVESPEDAIRLIEAVQPGTIVDIDFSRRITGRTQVVLTGNTSQTRTASSELSAYSTPVPVDRERSTHSVRTRTVAEELPMPLHDKDRSLRYLNAPPQEAPTRRADGPPTYRPSPPYESGLREEDREEPERRTRLFDRSGDPDSRGRPFLPWRR